MSDVPLGLEPGGSGVEASLATCGARFWRHRTTTSPMLLSPATRSTMRVISVLHGSSVVVSALARSSSQVAMATTTRACPGAGAGSPPKGPKVTAGVGHAGTVWAGCDPKLDHVFRVFQAGGSGSVSSHCVYQTLTLTPVASASPRLRTRTRTWSPLIWIAVVVACQSGGSTVTPQSSETGT